MANLQKVVKVTKAQYNILASGGTVGGYTGLSNDYMNKFTADDGVMPNVTFLSEYYTDPDQFLDPGTDTFQVYRAFVRWSQDVKTFSISMNAGGGYTE